MRDGDGRSAPARRFRDLVEDFGRDLGGTLTTADAALCRLAATVTLRAEQLQADMVNGGSVGADDLVRVSNSAVRILTALGTLQRKRAPAKRTLAQHIEERYTQRGTAS